MQCLHESFQTVPCGVKVLDYGSGPVMLCTISAAAKASEIVLADYTENNRKCLRQWLNSEPDAFDWSPHFNYVVQDLEGKGEKEAREREDQVKKIAKNVVHCDITQNPPIQRGFDVLYDVVISCLALEAAAATQDEFFVFLKHVVIFFIRINIFFSKQAISLRNHLKLYIHLYGRSCRGPPREQTQNAICMHVTVCTAWREIRGALSVCAIGLKKMSGTSEIIIYMK